MLKRAEQPFRFYTQVSLPFMTGIKASSLRHFADNLKVVPESVLYQHTHRFLQQHQYLTPEPPNDFAFWITQQLQLDRLGEQVAAIDTIRFNSLNGLRDALLKLIEGHLREYGDKSAPPGREFPFMRSVRFSLPTNREAWDLNDFAEALTHVTISSLYFHIFEARLREPLGNNDFSLWLENQLGEIELSKQISRLDPYTQTMEGLRQRILSAVKKRIAKETHAVTG